MYEVSMIDGHIDEPKLTDNEIIKALECCTTQEMSCENCPNKNQGLGCVSATMKQTLDLINRQKAEIERLKYNLKAVLAERKECNCPDGCPGTLTTYEQIEMGIKK